MNSVLELQNIVKQYKEKRVPILDNINLTIERGEFVALVGSSGSGKSTLLHIAGLLDTPTSGAVLINGERCSPASDAQRTKARRKYLGFVYQFHHLLQELSVVENVMLSRKISGFDLESSRPAAISLLQEMGLGDKITHKISSLSGGERQRVAISRALVKCPHLLLADEPTGSLDPEVSHAIFSIMYDAIKSKNLAALIATHNYSLAKRADKIYLLNDGKLVVQ